MYLLFDISTIYYYDHINHILNKKEENKKRKMKKMIKIISRVLNQNYSQEELYKEL